MAAAAAGYNVCRHLSVCLVLQNFLVFCKNLQTVSLLVSGDGIEGTRGRGRQEEVEGDRRGRGRQKWVGHCSEACSAFQAALWTVQAAAGLVSLA